MIRVQDFAEKLLVFFCFFPFLGINIGTDMQPFAFLVAIFLLFWRHKICVKYKYFLVPLVIYISFLSVASSLVIPIGAIIKRLFSYASLLVIFLVSYSIFREEKHPDIEYLSKKFHCVWALVGFIQTVYSRKFLTFLIGSSRTTSNRGVCSLASEPSFYGYMCFFFFLFALKYKKDKYKFCLLSIVQVFLFAQSAVALIYFAIFFGVFLLFKVARLNIKHVTLLLVTIAVMIIVMKYHIISHPGSRMSQIFTRIMTDPRAFFASDASASSRLNSIIRSFSRKGLPTPIGYGGNLLHSGFGSVFYELGFGSVLLFWPIWKSLYNGYENNDEGKTLVVSLTISMLSGIQLSLPLAALFYGICASRKSVRRN